jgi:hypothetical protein
MHMGFRGPQPEPTLPDGRYRVIIPGVDVVVIRTAKEQRQPASAAAKSFDSGCFSAKRISGSDKLMFAASLRAQELMRQNGKNGTGRDQYCIVQETSTLQYCHISERHRSRPACF